MIEVYAYGHFRVLRRRNHGGPHERNIVVYVMHFRMRDNYGAIEFFRRADHRLQTVESRCVEHPHGVLFFFCDLQNLF